MTDTAPSTGGYAVTLYEHETDKTDYLRVTFPRTSGRTNGEIVVRPSEYEKRSQFISRLMDLGALTPDKHNWPTYAQISSSATLLGVPITTSTIGWKGKHPDRGFLLPGHWVGNPNAEILLMPETLKDCIASGTAGDLSTWTQEVAVLAREAPYTAICLLTSLAGALLLYSRIRESFIVNIAGQSSTGKTSAVCGAASVWGNPETLWTWDATPRALAEAAASHMDLCLIPDDTELGGDRKKSGLECLQEAIHTLASGKPKRHSRAVSGADKLPRLQSRCTVLASSPETVEAHYQRRGLSRTDGDRVRLLEMQVPSADEGGIWKYCTDHEKRTPSELSDTLHAAARANYGVAGRAWVAHLVENQGSIEQQVAKYSRDFINRYAAGATGPKLRIAEKVALLFATARIARKAQIIPWSTKRAREITSFAYREILKAGFSDEADAIALVGTLWEKLRTRGFFLKVRDTALTAVELPGDLVGFAHINMQRVYIRYDAFFDICEQTLPDRAVGKKQIGSLISALQANGALLAGHGRGSTQDIKVAKGQLKFLVFDLNVIRKIARNS